MNTQETRSEIGRQTSAKSKLTAENEELSARIIAHLAGDRVDELFIKINRDRIATNLEHLSNINIRITKLSEQLPSSDEVAAARIEVDEQTQRAAAHLADRLAVWETLTPDTLALVDTLFAVHDATLCYISCKARIDELKNEYGLSVPSLPDLPTPPVVEMKLLMAAGQVLTDIGMRQICTPGPLEYALNECNSAVTA